MGNEIQGPSASWEDMPGNYLQVCLTRVYITHNPSFTPTCTCPQGGGGGLVTWPTQGHGYEPLVAGVATNGTMGIQSVSKGGFTLGSKIKETFIIEQSSWSSGPQYLHRFLKIAWPTLNTTSWNLGTCTILICEKNWLVKLHHTWKKLWIIPQRLGILQTFDFSRWN